jgi:predicted hydrocarbon binding protein
MAQTIRKELGDYMSTECFRYLRMGAEDTAGRALIVAAGRQRGLSLADVLQSLGNDTAQVAAKLNLVLGKEGTRLCIVREVKPTEYGYEVRIEESACSMGMKTEEPNCAFTMGVFIGALEIVSKRRLTAKETNCVAIGDEQCVYVLEYI